jgi:ATP-dependent RNA helicase DeaD
MKRGVLNLSYVKVLVLDEADRMLDMGFIDDVRKILDWTSRDRQTMLFSATMPKEIRDLSHRYMRDPQSLTVSTDAVPIDKIKQTFVLVERKKKFPMLLTIIRTKHPKLALIFARTKFGADKLAHQLSRNGVQAQAIHGDLSQNNRDRTMRAFKAGQIRFLVATDLASRGIDVTGITHVINFDLPDEPSTYSHRVGRTARAGAEGQAITLVLPEQYKEFSDVQRINGQRIEREHLQGEVQGEWFTDRKETAQHQHAYRYKFGQKYDNDLTR